MEETTLRMNRPETGTSLTEPPALPPEEQARADFYGLIARLLLAAPDAGLLAALANTDALAAAQGGNPLDQAWDNLTLAAAVTDVDAVTEEYDALFISTGTPAVNPFASLYLAGFMMEKPLATLRADLARLGLARMRGSGEPEDHLGALCETMRILIGGAARLPPQALPVQKGFFEKHIAPWHAACINDIRHAQGANFYQRVADFIQAFFEIEAQAFDIEDIDTTACALH